MKLYNTKNQEIPLERLVKDKMYYFEDTYESFPKSEQKKYEFNAIVIFEEITVEDIGQGDVEIAVFTAISLSSFDDYLKPGCLINRTIDDNDVIIKELEN